MKEFKPIISNQEGQNLFPGYPTVVMGTNITMKNTKPQVAITPYGASYMSPGQDYDFAGDSTKATVAEFPIAQMGGQGAEGDGQEQLMQILQIYAQMKQIPIEKLVEQISALSDKEKEQSITAIVEQVQSAMQEQQMQQQQMAAQQMSGNQQQMPMAMAGGRSCIDCEEQFPQAQNLNWFYKAEGGEAFPQANPYPHMYADGGEAFPQAVNMNAFMGKSSNDFMFQSGGLSDQYGGTTDIDQAYQMMKLGGMDMNPKKKKGGKFTPESFEEYVMKNGGYLPKHQATGSTFADEYNKFLKQKNDFTNSLNERDRITLENYRLQNSKNTPQNPRYASRWLNAGMLPTKSNVGLSALNALASAIDFGANMVARRGGGLPKHQFMNSTIGSNNMRLKENQSVVKGLDAQGNRTYNFDNIPDTGLSGFDLRNTATNTQGFDYSFKPGSTADPNNPNFEEPLYNQQQKEKSKRKLGFDMPYAAQQVANLNAVGDVFKVINTWEEEDKNKQKGPNTSAWMPVTQSNDKGNYMANTGMFRPNDYTYPQSRPGMQNEKVFYGQTGGTKSMLDFYQDGDEVDLDGMSEQEVRNFINAIYAAGGSVEYL
jgi:hypothetical protein